MNHFIQLFILGFFGLLVLLISGASAACTPDPNCDCDPENIQGCDATGITVGGTACGSEFGCALANDIYQLSNDGNFCHFDPYKKGCSVSVPNSSCNK